MNLVIVESPTKAKTISRFLGQDFVIESSYGHVRDLPKKELGIDVENNFKPKYVIFRQNQKRITALRKKAEKSKLVYFATDEDREGEAIAWHLQEISKLSKEKTKRITFHEITKEAILEALKNPRQIDMNLVNAQQARRILDRLVGYELSPFLWKKIARGLSAGRVQSVATRLIVEREREIKKFKPEEYWSIKSLLVNSRSQLFEAELVKIDSKKIEQVIKLKLFATDYTTKKTSITTEKDAQEIIKNLETTEFKVTNIDKKETKRNPGPPFTTARLQQEAARRLGFSSKQTMRIAQQLYEGIKLSETGNTGLITYMRTDSVNLSQKFLNESRDYIKNELGPKYVTEKSRVFKTKSKVAQEAHEAIRPTEAIKTPNSVKEYLDSGQFKLYDLIWRKAIASQMSSAIVDSTGIDIRASNVNSQTSNYLFRATGSTIKFDGYLKIYQNAAADKLLPDAKVGEKLNPKEIKSEQHFTTPPPRYTEASLIKTLEEHDIGRPSTYASIMSTIQDRNYVEKNESKQFVPTDMGTLVNDVLSKHFTNIVDIKFTAEMENDLDEIASGRKNWTKILNEFYQPFIKNLEQKEKELIKEDIIKEEKTGEKCPKCNGDLVIKFGKFGKFLACSNFPECKFTKPLESNEEKREELTSETCPKCGNSLVIKQGKFGKFMACSNYPECKFTKPIIKSMGIKCPQCGKGEIIERKTKKNRLFYGCSNYPECKFVLWSKPTSGKCPKCGSLLVYGTKETIKCSKKECDFSINKEE